ncbi:uncharacterized protein LOC108142326 [Drosophila elegans]|uniref:uncharacterized protein LOC108142326 n=1 Tax=Drosophila elegans TaxID=30023 RepID=UPI0007E6243B|nr:uncharacterized protein LOC108142326 [Drosophila elegans]
MSDEEISNMISNIPDEVIDYLVQQRRRERDLKIEKEVIRKRLKKVQDMMQLLEGRDDGITCTISAGNVYQMSTVQQVRDHLAANLSSTMVDFVKAHRKLLRLQSDIRQDMETVWHNVNNIETV